MANRQVLVFVKEPVPGRVKTRLAERAGADAACRFYRTLAEGLLAEWESTEWSTWVVHDPPDGLPEVRAWLGGARNYRPQAQGDLGVRMRRAFEEGFAEGAAQILLVGTDIPQLGAAELRRAFDLLDRYDAALGPAVDGGYYLVGFRRETFHPEIFSGMAWSSPSVLDATRERLREAGASAGLLEPLLDIDTLEDARQLLLRSRDTPFRHRPAFAALEALLHAAP